MKTFFIFPSTIAAFPPYLFIPIPLTGEAIPFYAVLGTGYITLPLGENLIVSGSHSHDEISYYHTSFSLVIFNINNIDGVGLYVFI